MRNSVTYGATLKAEADEVKSVLQVKPHLAKLLVSCLLWLGPRGVATDRARRSEKKSISANSKQKAEEEYDEAMKQAIAELHKDKKYEYPGDTDGKQKYANVSNDLDELIKRKKLAGQDVSALEKVKKELNEGWTKYRDETSDDYYENAKQAAERNFITSVAKDLIPEITALFVVIIGRIKMAKTLGGVSITSGDNNINLGAKKTVSVHTETGILLDTGTALNDAGKWGVGETDYKAKAAAGGMDTWNVTGGTVSTFFPANAAPTIKFVATDTALFSVHADYHLAATTNEWISQATTHTLRTDGDASPKAQVKMTEADKTIEAKVAADGKIILTRGDAKPKLELSDVGGVLANGANVQLTLTDKEAQLSAQGGSGVISLAAGKQSTLQGDNAGVTCKNNKITIDPGGAGSAEVCGITFQRSQLKANGVMQLEGGMIKIG